MSFTYLKNFKKTYSNLANYGVFLLNLGFAFLISFGISGSLPRIHDSLMIFCILNLLWLKPILFKAFLPLLLIWIFYSPIGFLYGYPNYGMIASLLETNTNEALEFFDVKIILYAIFIGFGFFIIYKLNKSIIPTQKQLSFFKYFSILLTIVFVSSIGYECKKRKEFTLHYSELLNFVPHIYNKYSFYKNTQSKLQELANIKQDWTIISNQQKYQNYILVIGESASKNYLSAYGYPIKTSPFLEKVHGIKYTQMISPAPYTTQSVPRLLSTSNNEIVEFYHNIIGLANQANIETYWISNQDKTTIEENEIHYIANGSNKTFYLSELAPTSKRYDYQLLPIVKDILAQKSNKPKLIVLHLMGSHAKFSKRVDFNKTHFRFKDEYLSDYLSSLLQTDELIANLYTQLLQTKQPFSIVYTADHALMPTTLKHGVSQFSLQTPLFKINSDDTTQITNNDVISGLGFVWFLSEWLGIETKNQDEHTFFNHYKVNDINDVYFFNNGLQSYVSAPAFDDTLLKPNDDELGK